MINVWTLTPLITAALIQSSIKTWHTATDAKQLKKCFWEMNNCCLIENHMQLSALYLPLLCYCAVNYCTIRALIMWRSWGSVLCVCDQMKRWWRWWWWWCSGIFCVCVLRSLLFAVSHPSRLNLSRCTSHIQVRLHSLWLTAVRQRLTQTSLCITYIIWRFMRKICCKTKTNPAVIVWFLRFIVFFLAHYECNSVI